MNDPLFGNKLAAAVLVALLLFFGLPQLASSLIGGGGHHGGHGGELKLAYPIEFETDGAGDEAPVAEIGLGTLLADASASAGERKAALCKSCHSFEEGGANGAGPNLWNVVGRQVAAVSGFNYTSALEDFGGEWTYERLDKYLENSQSYIPGTLMVQKIGKDDQRADILAYLGSLSEDPVPFPEPEVAADETASAAEDAG